MLRHYIGLEVKFDGNGFLEIEIPRAYYGKVRITPGSCSRGAGTPTRGGALDTRWPCPEQERDDKCSFLFRVEKGVLNGKCFPAPTLQADSPLPTQVCGICGNFNDEEEDEIMMPNDELAQNDIDFVHSWQDKEANPK